METKISRVDFEENRRIIVVSDIHGNLGLFKRVLKKASYSPIKDILVINGNMIERGPHSLQTLRYISQLSDDGDVYVVMGNSEAVQLVFLSDESNIGNDKIFRYIVSRRITGRSCLLSEMFYEMELPVESAKDVERGREELKRRYMPEIMFMQSLPTIIETKDFIFVHGGIPNDDLESFEHTDAMQYLKRDAFLEHCDYVFPKFVITGGWPCNLYNSKIQSQRPIIDKTRKIVAMAGGAGYKFDGQVNALIINNPNKADFGFVSEDGFQEAVALTMQKPSADSINIRRTSNLVKILELGTEFSYVQHRVSGKKLYMYNRYLHSEDEYTTCEDYTDYELDVKPGDKLNILFETSRGYYCKKNGVTGWYKGSIEFLPREEIITKEDLLSMHQSTQVVMVDTKLSYNKDLKKEIEKEEKARKEEKELIENINTALMERVDPDNLQIDIPLDDEDVEPELSDDTVQSENVEETITNKEDAEESNVSVINITSEDFQNEEPTDENDFSADENIDKEDNNLDSSSNDDSLTSESDISNNESEETEENQENEEEIAQEDDTSEEMIVFDEGELIIDKENDESKNEDNTETNDNLPELNFDDFSSNDSLESKTSNEIKEETEINNELSFDLFDNTQTSEENLESNDKEVAQEETNDAVVTNDDLTEEVDTDEPTEEVDTDEPTEEVDTDESNDNTTEEVEESSANETSVGEVNVNTDSYFNNQKFGNFFKKKKKKKHR